MNAEVTYSIIGFCITIGIAINAFFLKSLVTKLYNIEVLMARLSENFKNAEKTIDSQQDDLKSFRNRLHEMGDALNLLAWKHELKLDQEKHDI